MLVVMTDKIYVILYFRNFANQCNQTLISVRHVGERNVSICLQPIKKKREKWRLLLIIKSIHKLCQLIIHSICFSRLSRTNLKKLDYLSWNSSDSVQCSNSSFAFVRNVTIILIEVIAYSVDSGHSIENNMNFRLRSKYNLTRHNVNWGHRMTYNIQFWLKLFVR